MMGRGRSGLVYATVAIQVLLMAGHVWLDQLANAYRSGFRTDPATAIIGALSILVFPAVGLFIFVKRPDHPIGWLLVLSNVAWAVNNFAGSYVRYGIVSGRELPVSPATMAWFYWWPNSFGFGFLILLVLLLPTGHVHSPNWRWVLRLTLGWMFGSALLNAFAPGPIDDSIGVRIDNPLGLGGPLGAVLAPLAGVSLVLGFVLLALAFAAMTVRIRASPGLERQQLKWIFSAAALVVLLIGLDFAVMAYYGSTASPNGLGVVINSVVILSPSLIPIAAGIAILRYRLYDIDRIISRTLAYAILTAILGAVYLVGFLGLQSALAPFTANGGPVAVAASTLVVFALFQPVRRRIQGAVDRRFYRSRYDAAREIESFAARVRDEVEVDRLARANLDDARADHATGVIVDLASGSGPMTLALRRLGSLALIVPSIAVTIVVSIGTDALLLKRGEVPLVIIAAAALFNATTLLQALTGALIEWRRQGHLIGRLLLISGPLYAFLGASWLTSDSLQPLVDPTVYQVLIWVAGPLAWAGVALIAGWVPLLFPTGSLPGRNWRLPALVIAGIGTAGVVAIALKPGDIGPGTGTVNPFAIEAWPPELQVLVDAVPIALVALIVLAVAGLGARYRRGDRVERLQVRWLLAAVSVVVVGAVGAVVEFAVRTGQGPLFSALVLYVGILLIPIAIGIAILRYRLYEIDRIISRGVTYGLLTAMLALVYAGSVVGLQGLLSQVAAASTVAVAASTLVVAALFQPLRRRIQHAVDRRFNRRRYDAAGEVEGFAAQVRDEVEVDRLAVVLAATLERTMQPASASIWLRSGGSGR